MTEAELKHALQYYRDIYRWWTENSNRIEAIINDLEGVKAIRTDKELEKPQVTNRDPYILDLIEKKDKLIATSKHYEQMVSEVHDFIDWLDEPYKQMVIDKYFNEINDTKMELKYCYSRMQIWRIINYKVNDYIKLKDVTCNSKIGDNIVT